MVYPPWCWYFRIYRGLNFSFWPLEYRPFPQLPSCISELPIDSGNLICLAPLAVALFLGCRRDRRRLDLMFSFSLYCYSCSLNLSEHLSARLLYHSKWQDSNAVVPNSYAFWEGRPTWTCRGSKTRRSLPSSKLTNHLKTLLGEKVRVTSILVVATPT